MSENGQKTEPCRCKNCGARDIDPSDMKRLVCRRRVPQLNVTHMMVQRPAINRSGVQQNLQTIRDTSFPIVKPEDWCCEWIEDDGRFRRREGPANG